MDSIFITLFNLRVSKSTLSVCPLHGSAVGNKVVSYSKVYCIMDQSLSSYTVSRKGIRWNNSLQTCQDFLFSVRWVLVFL